MKVDNSFIFFSSLLLLFFSCSKDKPVDNQGSGIINLTIQWDKVNSNATLPETFIVQLNEDILENIKGRTHILKNIPPGTYKLAIYNEAENIILNQSKATVKYNDDSSQEAIPEWFFSSGKEVIIPANTSTDVIMKMKQQNGEVTIQAMINDQDRLLIRSIKTKLTGVADSFDLLNEKMSGNQTVTDNMQSIPGGYSSYYRLLGVDESETSKLFFHFEFTNGTTNMLEVDLTGTCMDHFNYIKHESHLFTFRVEINQDGPTIHAVIKDWEEKAIDITPSEI